MALHVLLVDDDAVSRNLLARLVDQHPNLELVEQCDNPLEALDVLQETDIDVMFLDIEMPEMSGLDLIRSMDRPPPVVLVSGNEQYAVEAFELEVIDYLVKPVTLPRFTKAVSRLKRNETKPKQEDKPVFVKVDGRLVKLNLDSVRWIEAKGDYALIQTTDKSLITHTTLKALVEKLPADLFARVHRSFIVHLDHIDDIDDATLVIGTKTIPIGSSYRTGFMSRLRLL